MKRIVFIILTLFLVFINISSEASSSIMTKELKVVSVDGFNITANFMYPKIKKQKEFKTVVLLHSLGYSSQWWGDFPKKLLNDGYAVLTIDLRGHGNSIYNSKLVKTSWKNLTNKAYLKYPQDVISVINYIKEENTKKVFFDDWAIVGCDIGASTGILVADKLTVKPKTIVIIDPVVKAKELYVPVSIAQLDGVDFLAITSNNDLTSKKASAYLKKFAQNSYFELFSDSKASGMVMLKNDPNVLGVVEKWLGQYLN